LLNNIFLIYIQISNNDEDEMLPMDENEYRAVEQLHVLLQCECWNEDERPIRAPQIPLMGKPRFASAWSSRSSVRTDPTSPYTFSCFLM